MQGCSHTTNMYNRPLQQYISHTVRVSPTFNFHAYKKRQYQTIYRPPTLCWNVKIKEYKYFALFPFDRKVEQTTDYKACGPSFGYRSLSLNLTKTVLCP